MLTFVGWLTCGVALAELSPTVEFDIPYQVRVLAGGTVLEVSGSFSWALPQNVQAMLASAPEVRVVRLESSGGHVLPALQLATIIQQHGFDTYVGRLCASACTVAFLGGRERWLAPEARLGFHQAFAPGFPPEQANAFLQAAYEKFAVPQPFVARVLRTPHTDVWYPTQSELQAVHYTTGAPPASMLALGGSQLARLSDITPLLRSAPDDAVIRFATALSELIGQVQATNPEACWAFTHEGPDDPRNALPQTALDAIAAAQRGLAESAKATRVQTPDADQRKKAAADLLAAVSAKGQVAALQGLRAGANYVDFCPSLHELLEAALALPDLRRAPVLRSVLSGG
jgi:hypothetical protein